MKTYYLAHSLTKRKLIRKWQIRLEGKYNIKFLNPFYNNTYERAEIEKLDKMHTKKEKRNFQQSWNMETCKRIVSRNFTRNNNSGICLSYPCIYYCGRKYVASLVAYYG